MPTKAELIEDLEELGVDAPSGATKAELEQMLALVDDEDDGEVIPDDDVVDPMAGMTDTVMAMETGLDDEDDDADLPEYDEPADGFSDDGTPEDEDLSDEDARAIAALFGEYGDDEDDEDHGAGDLDGEYVEVADTYHVDSLLQGRRGMKPNGMDLADKLDLAAELTDEELARVVKGTMRKAVETAREQGRAVCGIPVIAHRWRATGSGRQEVVVQVPVKPRRRTASGRRRDRRARRS